jgi:hypothetical protein
MRTNSLFVSAAALLLSGCGFLFGDGGDDGNGTDSSTQTPDTGVPAGTCDIAALASQCPVASRPLFGNDAVSRCDIATGGTYESGLDAGLCQGAGACVVACNFENPCQCGVESITAAGVFCVDCTTAAACGNAICEPGEDDGSCEIDCGSTCTTGTVRCNGASVENCVGGSWRPDACGPGQTCQYLPTGPIAFCVAEAAPYDEALPEVGPASAEPTDWRDVVFPTLPISCNGATGFTTDCGVEGLIYDGTRVLLSSSGITVRMMNIAEGTFEAWPEPTPTGTFQYADYEIAACEDERLPRWRNMRTGVVSEVAAVVDDVVLQECVLAVISADGSTLAASLLIADRPVVGVWKLPTGELDRVLRYDTPQDAGKVPGRLHISDDASMILEVRQFPFSSQFPASTIVWNVRAGTYAGVYEGQAEHLRPGARGWLSGLTYFSLDPDTEGWARTRGNGVFQLYGFTPDGEYVWGDSPDEYGTTRLTLYDADTGRVFFRFPIEFNGSLTGGLNPREERVIFSRAGGVLKIGGLLYTASPF